MNKRIRKKKHLGEFVQYGFRVKVGLVHCAYVDVDSWMEEVVEFAELHDLTVGGGFSPGAADFVVERIRETRRGGKPWWKSTSATEVDRKLFAEFFTKENVKTLEVGPLLDIWHNDFGY